MPWNGSGSFALNQDFPADRDSGDPDNIIDADKVDDEFQNIKTGLENCLTRDGQNTMSGTLKLEGNSIGVDTGATITVTEAELTQIANIDSSTISATQWGYLGDLDQALTTASVVTFGNLNIEGVFPRLDLLETDGTYGARVMYNVDKFRVAALEADGTLGNDIISASVDANGGTTVSLLTQGTEAIEADSQQRVTINGTSPSGAAKLTVNGIIATPQSSSTDIASGSVTVSSSDMRINTEASASSDDLDTLSGGADGMIATLKIAASSRDVTVKHGTGNISLAGETDCTLGDRRDRVVLQYDGGLNEWVELSRSINS